MWVLYFANTQSHRGKFWVEKAGHLAPNPSALGHSDCVWLVPTWVPPTPEPEE